MKFQYYHYILSILLCLSSFSYAQNSGDFIKANKAFNNAEYSKAENIFMRAYQRSQDRDEKNEIAFKLAQCYFYLGNYKKAEQHLRRAIKMRYDNPMVHYYLAECHKANDKFEKAQEEYERFIKLDPNNPKGPLALKSLELSQQWMRDGSKYRVVNAGNVLNSKADDFAPFLQGKNNEKIYFTSSREGVFGKNTNNITGQYFTDLFFVEKKEENGKRKGKKSLKPPVPPSWDLNTLGNDTLGLEDLVNLKNSEEGVVSFNRRGNRMFFTRAIFEKNRYQGRRIYSATFRGKSFRDATMEIIPVDTLVDVHGPSVSADEKSLFFAAEIEGGFGGTDIYVSHYDRRTKAWGKPENLGQNINSPGNEGFPFFNSETKNLYFSSDGRPGMGRLDIYKAEYNDLYKQSANEMFNEAENLKYPMNTPYNDFGITFEKHPQADEEPELKGYFSSDRVGNKWKSKGNLDIYYFDKLQIFFNLEGVVVDVEDGSPIKGAEIELIGPSTSYRAHTNGFGKFTFDICNFKEDANYRLVVNKNWFFEQVDTTITTDNFTSKDCIPGYITKAMEDTASVTAKECGYQQGHYEHTFFRKFKMLTKRRPLVLKSVLFDLGKSNLRDESKAELDSLASLLNNDWTNVVVELRSHTDFRGSDTLNNRLSLDRAKSCVDYLVEKGVNRNRLVPLGMASQEPVVIEESEDGLPVGEFNKEYIGNLKSNKLKEYAHQRNRRTDFKVLSDNYERWLKDNPNSERAIQRAMINEKGQVIPMDNTKGNFVEQVN